MRFARRIKWLAATATVASLAQAEPIVAGFARFHRDLTDESRAIEAGLLLWNELNCVACHEVPAPWRERVPGRGKISLAGVGSRLPFDALVAFIADPQRAKPGTTMPAMVRDELGGSEAVSAYLATLQREPQPFPAGDTARGQRLYENVGCVACHVPPAGGSTDYASVPIALVRHYERNALSAFLQDPLPTRPAGRMPATPLSDAEAADLAAYLKSGIVLESHPAVVPGKAPIPDQASLTRGQARWMVLRCSACHDTGAAEAPKPAKPLVQLAAERGCLASKPTGEAPDFSLSAAQVRALAAALRCVQANPTPPPATAEHRVVARFEQLNCYACHEFRGRGGPEAARAKFFTAADAAAESLGDMGHLPPKLDQAGRKLTPAWLERLLWGQGGGVRPYMTGRMPRYGAPAAGDLVALLAEASVPRNRS